MKRQFQSFDFLLVLLVVAIAIFGIIAIGSATHINLNGTSDEFEAQKLWLLSGLVLMLLAAFIDYHFICKFYIVIYLLNIALLVIVLFIPQPEGILVNRWIRYGKIGIQPSEFSKIFMIIFLAKFIDKKSEKVNNIFYLAMMFGSVALTVGLIMKQPSLSVSLVIGVVSLIIIYAGNLSYKYILTALVLMVPSAIFFYIDLHTTPHILIDKILTKYQIDERIMPFLYPDPASQFSEQTNRSIYAIGSGQLSGKGLYDGVLNQLSYLPASHTDFIFSVIGEEFGFLGCVIVLGVMLLIIFKSLLAAHKSPDLTGKLLCTGVAAMLFFQAFVNVGVVTGALPNTGMPFPFVSYGGSSMWINMIAIGLVLNVGMSKSKSFFEG